MISPTILVLEDEEPIRQMIATALRKNGYQVIDARNPKEAIQIVGSSLIGVD